MTVGECNDINTLLRYVYGLSGYTVLPTPQEAQEAVERLADRASKSLGAGLSGSNIRAAKDRLPQLGDRPEA